MDDQRPANGKLIFVLALCLGMAIASLTFLAQTGPKKFVSTASLLIMPPEHDLPSLPDREDAFVQTNVLLLQSAHIIAQALDGSNSIPLPTTTRLRKLYSRVCRLHDRTMHRWLI